MYQDIMFNVEMQDLLTDNKSRNVLILEMVPKINPVGVKITACLAQKKIRKKILIERSN